jgi:hypothetical protein
VAVRGAILDGYRSELWALALALLYVDVVYVLWRRFRSQGADDPLTAPSDSATPTPTKEALRSGELAFPTCGNCPAQQRDARRRLAVGTVAVSFCLRPATRSARGGGRLVAVVSR